MSSAHLIEKRLAFLVDLLGVVRAIRDRTHP